MDAHAGSLSPDSGRRVDATGELRAAAVRFIKHREDLFVRSVVNFIQI
jgi:hypothetical protein